MIQVKYKNFYLHLYNKFGNYELKYTMSVFLEKLFSIVNSYSLELSSLELDTTLNDDNIGIKSKTDLIGKNQAASDNINSYAGFNVDGEYNKIKSRADNTTTNSTNSYILDYYSYLLRANSATYSANWRNIESSITNLLVMYIGGM